MNHKSRTQTANSLMLTLAAVIWGLAFVAQSSSGDYVGPYTFTCVRNFVGGLVLLPIMYIFDKIGISHKPSNKAGKKLLLKGGILTGTALCIASNLQQVGIIMGTSAGKAGFLTACYILLVPVLGIFLHKKCPLNVWISVGITLIGLYLLCINGDFSIKTADILLLLCALAFSVQILCVDHFSPMTDAIRLSCIEFFTCGILSAIPMFFVEIAGHPLNEWIATLSVWGSWLPILYAGICSSGIAYTLQVFGQRDLNPTIASLIMSLESVFSLIGGWLLLHQKLTLREIIGCVIIFAAIVLSQLPLSKK